MVQEYKTLAEFIARNTNLSPVDDPNHSPEWLAFYDGNYEMSEEHFKQIEGMGQRVMDLAQKYDLDITKFPEVQVAMGYDVNPDDLTPEELGSLIVGIWMQDETYFTPNIDVFTGEKSPGMISDLRYEENLPRHVDNPELAENLGQQVYGDNMGDSSVDTKTKESLTNTLTLIPK